MPVDSRDCEATLAEKLATLRRIALGPVLLDRLPSGKARRLALPELEALRRATERPAAGDKVTR